MRSITLCLILFVNLLGFSQEQDTIRIRLEKNLDKAESPPEKIKALMAIGEYEIEYDIKQAEAYLSEARQLAESDDSKIAELAFIYNQLGVVNRRKALYGDAIEFYLKSKDLYEKIKDTSNVGDVIHNIGMVYRYQEQDSVAVEHFKVAIRLNRQMKDTFGLAAAYNMIGVSYRRLNLLDSALVNYKRAEHLFIKLNSEEDLRRVNDNRAVVYSVRGEYDKSLPLKLKSLEYHKKRGKKMSICIRYHGLSKEYSRLGNPEKAKLYADSSLQIALKEGFKGRITEAYVRRSAVYRDMKNFEQAYQDYRLFKKYSDSIYGLESAERIKELELKYQLEKERNELEVLSEERKNKVRLYTYLFIAAVLIGGLVGYLLWRNYTARVRIVADKLEKEKLTKELLDEKVKVTEAELKFLVADNSMRLKFIKALSKQIKEDKKATLSKDIQGYTNSLILRLEQQIGTESKLTLLQERIEEINRGFHEKLLNICPILTKTEREVCALLRLNLSTKEISTIRNTSVQATKIARHRIRKKLNVPKSIDTEKFIQAL